jgi:hypothetical protein
MIPASTVFSMLQVHRACAGRELVAWNSTTVVDVRRGFAHFRKNWQARRDETVKD